MTTRRFTVYRRMYGTQTYTVDARSKADAVRKVRAGEATPLEFEVTDAALTMTALEDDA